jgi:hypothetical protein
MSGQGQGHDSQVVLNFDSWAVNVTFRGCIIFYDVLDPQRRLYCASGNYMMYLTDGATFTDLSMRRRSLMYKFNVPRTIWSALDLKGGIPPTSKASATYVALDAAMAVLLMRATFEPLCAMLRAKNRHLADRHWVIFVGGTRKSFLTFLGYVVSQEEFPESTSNPAGVIVPWKDILDSSSTSSSAGGGGIRAFWTAVRLECELEERVVLKIRISEFESGQNQDRERVRVSIACTRRLSKSYSLAGSGDMDFGSSESAECTGKIVEFEDLVLDAMQKAADFHEEFRSNAEVSRLSKKEEPAPQVQRCHTCDQYMTCSGLCNSCYQRSCCLESSRVCLSDEVMEQHGPLCKAGAWSLLVDMKVACACCGVPHSMRCMRSCRTCNAAFCTRPECSQELVASHGHLCSLGKLILVD